jgi:hypothetical protein
VQVSDSTTNGGAAAVRTDEPAEGEGDAVRRGSGVGARFRDTLKRGGGSEETGPSATAAAAAAGPAWFKPESIRAAPPPSRIAAVAAPKIDRVLIGGVGGEAEARIRIGGAGALAGAEIRLTAAAGSQVVTAHLLTPTAGSRETLSVAIEEIRLRLRDRGIALASSVARGRAGDEARRDGTAGGPDDAGAGAGSSSGWPAGW